MSKGAALTNSLKDYLSLLFGKLRKARKCKMIRTAGRRTLRDAIPFAYFARFAARKPEADAMTAQHDAQAQSGADLFELVFGRRPCATDDAERMAELRSAVQSGEPPWPTLLQLRKRQAAAEHAQLERLAQAPETRALLGHAGLERADFDSAYQALLRDGNDLIVGQREYLLQHKERFWELFKAASTVLSSRTAPCLLEFGMSEFSALYKRFFADLTLHLSDRPTPPDYIGFTADVAFRKLGCDAYFSLDLERPDRLRAEGALVPGSYDLILLTEVLEHLVVNPVVLLQALLRLLKPDGRLYLTTPNLFRAEHRERWLLQENPQAVYPAGDGNWDRHHHHREYGAVELLRFIREAGGEVTAFYFSACWDHAGDLPADERGNLVFLVAPGRP